MPSATLTTFTVATNEYRGGGNAERTEYHPCVAWDRLAEITGQFLSKGQLVMWRYGTGSYEQKYDCTFHSNRNYGYSAHGRWGFVQ